MSNIAELFVTRATILTQQAAFKPRFYATSSNAFELIKTEKTGAKQNVGLITLNRLKALDALCNDLILELLKAAEQFGKDDTIGAIVITGSEKAFAASADIKEMQRNTYSSNIKSNFIAKWGYISQAQKPGIAAVNGYALGGGCELIMMYDIIYAGGKAKFTQPEIAIGTIPGAGSTQRLTLAVGKSKAMEIVLTGNMLDADEAEKAGLISKVFLADQLLPKAVELDEKLSSHSPLIVALA